MKPTIRNFTPADLPAVLKMNNHAVPQVNSLTPNDVLWFADHAAWFRVAELDGKAAAFLIGLTEEASYDSEYFEWYTARYAKFLYVDRIIVAGWARRRGLATSLYHDAARWAAHHALALAAEVYSRPPNEPSLQFHRNFGFAEVGVQPVENGTKTVTKFYKQSP
ncbi:MAG: GNAT family N-acetyltransferase [Chloroflexi bacterium]|nr:MAG: GNAT family N-acetyltransferase [Chloroflexota bacterium]